MNSLSYQSQCSIDLADIKVKNGSYSVALNKNYIGVIDQENQHGAFSYSCDYLVAGENVLTIKNMINSGGSEIENLKTFRLEVQGQQVTADDAKLKLNSFIKLKFERPLPR